ncbi:hypothetical protein WDZ92_53280, partial [Nostoc sp. NIES-2111]
LTCAGFTSPFPCALITSVEITTYHGSTLMHTHFGERRSHVRTFEMVETDKVRRRMERAVEALLAALDEMDGDPDCEPDSDGEPWLTVATGGGHGCDDDREEDAIDWGQP